MEGTRTENRFHSRNCKKIGRGVERRSVDGAACGIRRSDKYDGVLVITALLLGPPDFLNKTGRALT